MECLKNNCRHYTGTFESKCFLMADIVDCHEYDPLTTQKEPSAESPACNAGLCKPCPFCGDNNMKTETHIEGRIFIQCQNQFCGGSSGMCDSEDEAITAWNRRCKSEDSSY